MWYFFISLFLFVSYPLGADKKECSWPQEWRQKALLRLDALSGQAVPFALRSFACSKEPSYSCHAPSPELAEFVENHGYFSCYEPIVGIVTDRPQDLVYAQSALSSLRFIPDPYLLQLSTAELLTKVLAYRHLEKGTIITIPRILQGRTCLIDYRVDVVLDLWQGMPAFGLVPLQAKEVPSLLLFRGTDFSLLSKRSWASVLSDLDISGVGFSVFQNAQKEIHQFLIGQKHKTEVLGFSLGGVLAIYTAFFENEEIADSGSIAFNPPGVSSALFREFTKVKNSKIALYVNAGDLVSKLGKLISPTWVLQGKEFLGPIRAHTEMMTAQESFALFSVDIQKENTDRFTMGD